MSKTVKEKKSFTLPPNPMLRALGLELGVLLLSAVIFIATVTSYHFVFIVFTQKGELSSIYIETFKAVLGYMYSVGAHWNSFSEDVTTVDTAAATVFIAFVVYAMQSSENRWETNQNRTYVRLPVFVPLIIISIIVILHAIAICTVWHSTDFNLNPYIISHVILMLLFLFMGVFIAYLPLRSTESLIKEHESNLKRINKLIDTINTTMSNKLSWHMTAGIIWILAWIFIQYLLPLNWENIILLLLIMVILPLFSDMYAIHPDKERLMSFFFRSMLFEVYFAFIISFLEKMPSKLSYYQIAKVALLLACLVVPFLLSVLVSREVPVKDKRWYQKLYWYILRPLSIRGLSQFLYANTVVFYLRKRKKRYEKKIENLSKHIENNQYNAVPAAEEKMPLIDVHIRIGPWKKR